MADPFESHSSDLQILGTQLSDRIQNAQAVFATFRKKCDHYVLDKLDGCVSKNTPGVHRQGVGFKKDGKTWKLFFVEEGEYERDPTQYEQMELLADLGPRGRSKKIRQHFLKWEELTQASLVNKSKAVKMLPQLLTEMQAEYERRTTLVREALQVLDQFDYELWVADTGDM